MISYKDSGVDVEAGYESVRLIKKHIARTKRPEVLSGIGGFGGLFAFNSGKYSEPVLISGTDGVGTKLKIAFLADRHDTVGIDCVAMCVNDIICSGAEPLFFLDYIACGKNYPEKIASIVKGVSEGCIEAGCALIGGETAEMPGFYPDNEYDLAGFAVGVVEKGKIIDGSRIEKGDVLIGLASSGLHSNSFSLVRKLLEPTNENINNYLPGLSKTMADVLLTPTKIYVKPVFDAISKFDIKGIAHITGGGFIENIPRMLPSRLSARILRGNWEEHEIFRILGELGKMDEKSMFNTFNMGIGMVLAVSPTIADELISYYDETGEIAYIIGEVKDADTSEGLEIC